MVLRPDSKVIFPGTLSRCALSCLDGDTGHRLETDPGRGTQQHDFLDAALERTFDRDWDRIIDATGSDVERGNGLSTALGFMAARDRMQEDRWVVCVAIHSSFSSVAGRLDRWDAFRFDRFLIVVAASSTETTDEDIAALRHARRRGVRVLDLTSPRTQLEMETALEQVRTAITPCVVLVDKVATPDLRGGTGDSDLSNGAGFADRLVDLLVDAVRADRRITPVLMSAPHPWWRLVDCLPASLLRVAPRDASEAIPWCLALADGGCHPVLIMNRRLFDQQSSRLADELTRDPQLMTVIVDDRDAPDTRIAESVGAGSTLSPDQDPLCGLPWVCADSSEEALVRLRTSLTERTSLAMRIRPPEPHMSVSNGLQGTTATRLHGASVENLVSDKAEIAAKPLSAETLSWVTEYEQLGHRGRYLWRWCLHGLELTTLSSVSEQYRQHLCDTKLLSVMFGVLLDDVADREQDGDFLQRLTTATLDGGERDLDDLSPARRRYADFTCRLWDCYLARVHSYPRYDEFAEILEYDARRVLNTMRYALLVNTDVRVMNRVEHDLYTPHNMQMMTFAMVDLMVSPGFDISELGSLRQAIWHAQCMGRIGNLVSTWERELAERDFSSGVFSRLMDLGSVSVTNLCSADDELIRKAVRSGGIESSFLDDWEQHRRELRAMVREVDSVDLTETVTALERLIQMEFFSRGLK